MTGIYHSDSIRDVAESLGISNLPEGVASMLASDVEYRLYQVIEEASRFTRHSKRTKLTTSDIDQAFKVLNIEPVYGHSGLSAPSFRKVVPAQGGPVYVLQDEEIDFDKIVREEEIPVPRPVSWTAHWLAVEGVQPLIPENPSPAVSAKAPSTTSPARPKPQANGATSTPSAAANGPPKPHLTTKSHLSRELQQYYARLTDSLLPSNSDSSVERKKTAALASLRNDAGLQGILPYLVKWIGESVINALSVKGLADDDADGVEEDVDRPVLEVMLLVVHAILDNPRLFVEPYLHMLLPPLLSILLTSTLSLSSSYSSQQSEPSPTPRTLRKKAASLLAHLLKLHAASYPSLPQRVTKTLFVALLDNSNSISLGSKEGAIRGLVGVGKEAVLRGVIDGGAGRVIGGEIERRTSGRNGNGLDDGTMVDLSGLAGISGSGSGNWTEEVQDVVDAFIESLAQIHPPPSSPSNVTSPYQMLADPRPDVLEARRELIPYVGSFFAGLVSRKDVQWARELADVLKDRNFKLPDPEPSVQGLQTLVNEDDGDMEILPSRTEVGLGFGLGGDMGALDMDAMDAS